MSAAEEATAIDTGNTAWMITATVLVLLMLFTALWLILVYAPAVYGVWGGGIMAKWNAIDLAGGIVVHATVALVWCIVERLSTGKTGVVGIRQKWLQVSLPSLQELLTRVFSS